MLKTCRVRWSYEVPPKGNGFSHLLIHQDFSQLGRKKGTTHKPLIMWWWCWCEKSFIYTKIIGSFKKPWEKEICHSSSSSSNQYITPYKSTNGTTFEIETAQNHCPTFSFVNVDIVILIKIMPKSSWCCVNMLFDSFCFLILIACFRHDWFDGGSYYD